MKIRRIQRRGWATAVVLALAAGTIAGCSSSGGGGSEGGSLRLLTYDDSGPAKLMRKQLKAFKDKTGIKVTLETLPGSGAAIYPDKLRTELLGGKAPDVWRIWGGSIGGPFATNGQALDLGPYYKKYDWAKEIPQSYIDGMTWDGKKYGLPLYSATVTAFYSKAAFQKAGITAPPKTYAELVADNEKLVASGQVPAGLGGKYGWDVMRLFEYLLEKDAGPKLHDKLLTGKASWDDPAVVKAFTELKEWNDKGWLPKGVLGIDPSNSEPGFTQGKYAYTLAGAWVDSQNIQKAKDPSAYGTFALPTGQTPNRHSGWVEGFMINAASKNQDDAAKLLDFLAKPSTQKALDNTQSTVKGAQPDPQKYPASAENAKIASSAPYYTIQDQALPTEVANSYFQIQSQVIQGAITPKAAAKQMQEAVSKGFKKK